MLRSMLAGLIVAAVLMLGSAHAMTPGTAYSLKAVIEPAAGTLSVKGDITVPATGAQLRFALHRTFEITDAARVDAWLDAKGASLPSS